MLGYYIVTAIWGVAWGYVAGPASGLCFGLLFVIFAGSFFTFPGTRRVIRYYGTNKEREVDATWLSPDVWWDEPDQW